VGHAYKRHIEERLQEKRTCEDGGRNRSYAATSQPTLGTVRNCGKLEEQGKILIEPSEEMWHFDLKFWFSELRE
jgi:hypothetical protein